MVGCVLLGFPGHEAIIDTYGCYVVVVRDSLVAMTA